MAGSSSIATTVSRAVADNRILPGRLPRICVALEAPTPAELFNRAERAAREGELVEFRLDALKTPAAAMAGLKDFVRSYPQVVCIATCRKQSYGGHFRGSLEAEWAILKDAANAGCAFVDIEMQVAERLPPRALATLRDRTGLILSFHDPKTTPDLERLFARMQRIPADIYKIAPTAGTWRHNVQLLQFLESNNGVQTLVAFCMGEVGVPSRILSLRSGAAFTFAALAPDEANAPGQLDLETLRSVYHAETINRATRVYGVLGNPVAHSLSPRMQNAAFRRSGINAIYVPLMAKKPEEVLDCADEIPFSGLSITQPFKSVLLKKLDGMDPLAKQVGAVNTIVRSQGKIYGYNTDVAGVVEPLAAMVPLRQARILVLGAGGAARAAVFGLRARGSHVFIHNRTRAHAQSLASAAGAKVVGKPELRKLEFHAIINATPVGQFPKVKDSPLEPGELHAPVVFDLVYNPMETALLKMARAVGARVIPGVEMFIHQGARQFEIWTGKPAPLDDMRREVLSALS